MYKVKFNTEVVATFDNEKDSLALALNLHNYSNVIHNIVVTKDDDIIISFIQR